MPNETSNKSRIYYQAFPLDSSARTLQSRRGQTGIKNPQDIKALTPETWKSATKSSITYWGETIAGKVNNIENFTKEVNDLVEKLDAICTRIQAKKAELDAGLFDITLSLDENIGPLDRDQARKLNDFLAMKIPKKIISTPKQIEVTKGLDPKKTRDIDLYSTKSIKDYAEQMFEYFKPYFLISKSSLLRPRDLQKGEHQSINQSMKQLIFLKSSTTFIPKQQKCEKLFTA